MAVVSPQPLGIRAMFPWLNPEPGSPSDLYIATAGDVEIADMAATTRVSDDDFTTLVDDD